MPTFDEMNVTLSNRVGDAVASAATNGTMYSSGDRVAYLNQASRNLMDKYVTVLLREDDTTMWTRRKRRAEDFLANHLDESVGVLSSNVLSLDSFSPVVDTILSVEDDTTSKPVARAPEGLAPLIENNRIAGWELGTYNATAASDTSNPQWSIHDNKLKVLGCAATDSIRIRYVSKYVDIAAAGTTLIPAQFHHQLINMAVILVLEDDPDTFNATRATIMRQNLDREIFG